MNSHSLKVLELQRIRNALAERACFGGGTRAIQALEPRHDAGWIERQLVAVSEVRRILEDSELPLYGVPDLALVLERAEPRGAVLTGVDLAQVGKSLQIVKRVVAYLQDREDALPELAQRSRSLRSLGELREKIAKHLDSEGEVRDNATPALRQIRRDKDRVRTQVNETLRKLARSMSGGDSEAVVTIRNDRYVLGVRRDRLQGQSGIVHGQSGSGQSVYIEPNAAVAGNNQLAELRSAELEEILRILTELTQGVQLELESLQQNELTLADLDVTYASGKLSRDLDAIPALPAAAHGGVELNQARHPALALANLQTGDPVVPLDLELGGERASTIVITGPNTGGKTVALKTVGLLVLMNQCGLHVPAAEGTRLPIFREVYADIGDEQSIEASLSTFSSHLANINEVLQDADEYTLVMLDEIGVGTDPEEGAALGKAILSELTRKGARVIVTTHYGSLKVFAHDNPDVENASLEFDRESLAPTYRFLQGVPGASEGISIARRLGLPAHLVEEARSYLGEEQEAVEGLLQDLSERRQELDRVRAELETAQAQTAEDAEKLERKLRGVADERTRLRKEALEDARRLVEQSKSELTELLGAVKSDGVGGKAAGRARTRLGELGKQFDRQLASEGAAAAGPDRPLTPAEVVEGLMVRIPSMGWKGTVLSPPGSNGKVAVSVGALRVEVPADSLERVQGAPSPAAAAAKRMKAPAVIDKPEGTTQTELDLRGRTVEEAVDEMDRVLDGLVVSGGTWLRIIHGKGTGALRTAITARLGEDTRIKSHRLGEPGEGGTGVTIAELK